MIYISEFIEYLKKYNILIKEVVMYVLKKNQYID